MISFLTEFWAFVRARRKFWLLPILFMLILLGGLLLVSEGSALSPVLYMFF